MSEDQVKHEQNIYKKWFKTRDKSGFISLQGWAQAGKISIDIGEIVNDQVRSTKVWTNIIEFAAYIKSITNNTHKYLYPGSNNMPDGSFIYYGGGVVDGKPISRVVKIHSWQYGPKDSPKYDDKAFAFKAAHFPAKKSQSGAYIPEMSSGPLSINMIKVLTQDIAAMSYRLDLYLTSFACNYPEKDHSVFLEGLNG